MPMKTARRRKCLFCGRPAQRQFHIELRESKRHIPIHTCGEEHEAYFRRVMRDFEVKHGG